MKLRKASERGYADHGWLNSFHTFSFADYRDPAHMGFRALRVINEDRVAGGKGFGTHPHRDMEIVTYVLSGALEHRDSMGTGSVIHPGDVQRMSAGTGVTHSEFNHSATGQVHFLQIWLLPSKSGIAPSYAQQHYAASERNGVLRTVISPNGEEQSITVHSDAKVLAGTFRSGQSAAYTAGAGRYIWVHIAVGSLRVNGMLFNAGDAAALDAAATITLEGENDAGGEVLVFDLG
jgi:quercetin 2,3-dioxygenase